MITIVVGLTAILVAVITVVGFTGLCIWLNEKWNGAVTVLLIIVVVLPLLLLFSYQIGLDILEAFK